MSAQGHPRIDVLAVILPSLACKQSSVSYEHELNIEQVVGIAIANARWATIVNVKVRGIDVNFNTTIRGKSALFR